MSANQGRFELFLEYYDVIRQEKATQIEVTAGVDSCYIQSKEGGIEEIVAKVDNPRIVPLGHTHQLSAYQGEDGYRYLVDHLPGLQFGRFPENPEAIFPNGELEGYDLQFMNALRPTAIPHNQFVMARSTVNPGMIEVFPWDLESWVDISPTELNFRYIGHANDPNQRIEYSFWNVNNTVYRLWHHHDLHGNIEGEGEGLPFGIFMADKIAHPPLRARPDAVLHLPLQEEIAPGFSFPMRKFIVDTHKLAQYQTQHRYQLQTQGRAA